MLRASAAFPRAAAESASASSPGIATVPSGIEGPAPRPPAQPATTAQRMTPKRVALAMKQLSFLEACVRIPRDHDVIQDVDAQDPPRLHEAAGDRQILLAGGRVSAWVIMREDQARGRDRDRGLIDLTRVDDARVQAPDGNDLAAKHLVPRVQIEADEVLPVGGANVPRQIEDR